MKYRPEIDGLRAVAVIPVIFFHAGFEFLSGGFVGVDIFFVISGYLITSIILLEKDNGSYSILSFYERRIRRILPALFVVMFVSIPLSWLLMTPIELKEFSRSLVAVPLFLSNILFWKESGYFDMVNEMKPLIHTWSLAVEEQFYVFYPLFISIVWKVGQHKLFYILVVITGVSLGVANWGVSSAPEATFFLLPTRGWELLVGGLLAVHLIRKPACRYTSKLKRCADEVLSVLGLLLICYAVCQFDSTTPFPGITAAIPVIGTALIILCSSQNTIVGKVLSLRICVGIGLISYSAYLWHQPLFAFFRYQAGSKLNQVSAFGLIIFSIVLAYLSWRFVEQPFRRKGLIGRKNIFRCSICCSVFFVVCGIVILNADGFSYREPEHIQWTSLGERVDDVGSVCVQKEIGGVKLCEFGDVHADKIVALYGDSHAQAISYQLDAEFKKEKVKGVRVNLVDGCQVDPNSFKKGKEGNVEKCRNSFDSLLKYVDEEVDSLILASRWTFRLYPVAGEIDTLMFDNLEGGEEFESYREYGVADPGGTLLFSGEFKKKSLEGMIKALLSTDTNVLLVYPVPELGWNVYSENYKYFNSVGSILPELSTSYDLYLQRNKFVATVFDGLDDRGKMYRVKPDKVFCDTFIKNRCVGQYNGVPFYLDDDHLSDKGAAMVVDMIMPIVLTEIL